MNRVDIEETEDQPKRMAPEFVLKPEPLEILEGDCAKFCVRLIGKPKPRVLWSINGNVIPDGTRYKLRFDGLYHLEIPKIKLSDKGVVEVYAKNAVGEAYCSTTLDVYPRTDDYRTVLKHSPKPYYDDNVVKYQIERQTSELERASVTSEEFVTTPEQREPKVRFQDESETSINLEKTTPAQTPDSSIERTKKIFIKSQPKPKEEPKEEAKIPLEESIDKRSPTIVEEKSAQQKTEVVETKAPPSPESVIHGKEVVVQTQKQIQTEQKEDLEIKRHIRETETVDHEHKEVVKERKVVGKVSETKAPLFTEKICPCRATIKSEASFRCTFSGLPTPSITWLKDNKKIESSSELEVSYARLLSWFAPSKPSALTKQVY